MEVANSLANIGEANTRAAASIAVYLDRLIRSQRNDIKVSQAKEVLTGGLTVKRKGFDNSAVVEATYGKAIAETLGNHQSAAQSLMVDNISVEVQKSSNGRIQVSAPNSAAKIENGKIKISGDREEITKALAGLPIELEKALPQVAKNEMSGLNKLFAGQDNPLLDVKVDDREYTVGKYKSGQAYAQDNKGNKIAYNVAKGLLGVGGNEVAKTGNTEQIEKDLPAIEAKIAEVMPLSIPQQSNGVAKLEIGEKTYEVEKSEDAYTVRDGEEYVTYKDNDIVDRSANADGIEAAIAGVAIESAPAQEEFAQAESQEEYREAITTQKGEAEYGTREEANEAELLATFWEEPSAMPIADPAKVEETDFQLEELIDPKEIQSNPPKPEENEAVSTEVSDRQEAAVLPRETTKALEELEYTEIQELEEKPITKEEILEQVAEITEETRVEKEIIYGKTNGIWVDGLDADTAAALQVLMAGELGATVPKGENIEVTSGGKILFATDSEGVITHNALITENGLASDRLKQQSLGITQLQASVALHTSAKGGIKVSRVSEKLAKVPKTVSATSKEKPKLNPSLGQLYNKVIKPGFDKLKPTEKTLVTEAGKFSRSKNKAGGYNYKMEVDGKNKVLGATVGAGEITAAPSYQKNEALQSKVTEALKSIGSKTEKPKEKEKERDTEKATIPSAAIQTQQAQEQKQSKSPGMSR